MRLLKEVVCKWLVVMMALHTAVAVQTVLAQEPYPEIELRIFVVHASNEGTRVDPKLNFIREELSSLFHYASYTLLATPEARLKMNGSVDIVLPSGHTAFVRYLGVHGDRIHLRLQIKSGKETIVNTDFEIVNGGNVLVGGPAYQNGVLILAVHPGY